MTIVVDTNLYDVGIVLRIATCDAKFSTQKKRAVRKPPFLLFPLESEFVNSNTFNVRHVFFKDTN